VGSRKRVPGRALAEGYRGDNQVRARGAVDRNRHRIGPTHESQHPCRRSMEQERPDARFTVIRSSPRRGCQASVGGPRALRSVCSRRGAIRSRANGLMAVRPAVRSTGDDATPDGGAALGPSMLQLRTQQGGRCEWSGCCPEPSGLLLAPSELQMLGAADHTDPVAAPTARPDMIAWSTSM
jgi:hypothetical protein